MLIHLFVSEWMTHYLTTDSCVFLAGITELWYSWERWRTQSKPTSCSREQLGSNSSFLSALQLLKCIITRWCTAKSMNQLFCNIANRNGEAKLTLLMSWACIIGFWCTHTSDTEFDRAAFRYQLLYKYFWLIWSSGDPSDKDTLQQFLARVGKKYNWTDQGGMKAVLKGLSKKEIRVVKVLKALWEDIKSELQLLIGMKIDLVEKEMKHM